MSFIAFQETSVGNSSQSHTHSHGISGTSLHPSSSHIQGRGQVTISADYPYVNYEFASTGDAISKVSLKLTIIFNNVLRPILKGSKKRVKHNIYGMKRSITIF